ncbi:hypothetical protein GCM10023093_11430 [Nemorincola caseinilytica]|uniref:Phosphopeptide-binding protein n=2 Tax=Nemorincola caseinilytica TaxID=2054315 RepID=A0ABP8N8T6_9BACT
MVAMLASCGNGTGETTNTDTTAAQAAPAPRKAPELAAVSASPEYAGATLKISAVKAEAVGKDSAKVSFAFDVKNYELKAQTADNANKLCNNSAQGQHIHFILDNKPYKALYEPKNEVTLANGTEHYLMVFLSRSYHESVKSPGAAVVYHFKVDEKGKLVKMEDPKEPMVFYSRPKGDYLGNDTANVLLDFYVWNGTLAADGYKVKATLTPAEGDAVTYTFDKWEPKFITGLPMGKSKLTLSLTDKDGKQVDGANTNVEREFNLAAAEPMK